MRLVIFENQLLNSEFSRTIHALTGAPGASPEDYLEPEVYQHVSGRKLKAGDRIEITADDATWYMEVLVRVAQGADVQVSKLSLHRFEAVVGSIHNLYEPKWRGPSALWSVLRKSDQAVMVEKLEAKSQAVAWIEEHATRRPEPLKNAA